jgi:hypothetical protein
MKSLFAIVLCVASFGALANHEHKDALEWTTVTVEGFMSIVLPDTAGVTKSGTEWYASVDIFENEKFQGRVWVHVNGCPKLRGMMLLIEPDGTSGDPTEWKEGGDTGSDRVAFHVCKAAYLKGLFKMTGTPPGNPSNVRVKPAT